MSLENISFKLYGRLYIVIQVLNHPVIPEILGRESNDRPSTQAREGDDWITEMIVQYLKD